jgi:activating signal cointegrator complex subunit 3
LANAKEFFGLPVRHNEDVLNEALTHLVPIKVAKHDLENPHVKANLLIQAHLQRCPLPITDYFTDTKSVLDQSIRVLQGMIDVAAHAGHLSTTMNLVHLMQMIVQGRWLDQSILVNIPHFNERIVEKLRKMGIDYIPQFVERIGGNLRKFLKQELKETFEVDQISEIYKVIERVPKVDL